MAETPKAPNPVNRDAVRPTPAPNPTSESSSVSTAPETRVTDREMTPVKQNAAITERPDRIHDENGGPVAEQVEEDTRSPEEREADRLKALRMTEQFGMSFRTAERRIREGTAPKEADPAKEDEGTVTITVSRATAREMLPSLNASADRLESQAAIGLATQTERDSKLRMAEDFRKAVNDVSKTLG